MKKCILILLLAVSGMAHAQEGSVIVTGFGNSAEEAKNNAFLTAIEQTAGVLISADMLMENGEIIRDRIRSNVQGYIESYTVISAGMDGDTHVLTIKAVVARRELMAAITEISHVNNAQMSYEAMEYIPAIRDHVWCKGGRISLFNMNHGIHADSHTLLRKYWRPGEESSLQIYVELTVPAIPYIGKALDAEGHELPLLYLQSSDNNARPYTGRFGVEIGFDALKEYRHRGLELTLKGEKQDYAIPIQGPYIEGFVKYIEENCM